MARVRLDLAAQAADVDADKIDFAVIFSAPDAFQQQFVGHHAPGVASKHAEQFIFRATKLNRPILQQYLVLSVVDSEVSGSKDWLVRLALALCNAAAQENTQAGQQFFHPKRFTHQVVRAQIKQAHALILVIAVAEHHHRDMRKLAQALQQFDSLHIRQVGSQQDQIRLFKIELAQKLGTIIVYLDAIALLLQIGAQVAGEARVTFDDSNLDALPPIRRSYRNGRGGLHCRQLACSLPGERACLSPGRDKGQRAIERRALIGAGRIGPDAPSVCLDGCAGHSQTQATSPDPLIPLRHAIEAIKNTIKMFGSDALALIANAQAQFVFASFQSQTNYATVGRVGYGVVKELVACLLNARGITEHRRKVSANLTQNAMARRILAPALHQLLQQFREIDLAKTQVLHASIQTPNIQQSIQDLMQPVGLCIDHLQHLALRGRVPANRIAQQGRS